MRVIFQCSSLNVAANPADGELVGVPQHDIVVVAQTKVIQKGAAATHVPREVGLVDFPP